MASLFRDRGLDSHFRRDSFSSSTTSFAAAASFSTAASRLTSTASTGSALTPLASPFGELKPTLSETDLRSTAYEIFLSANRSTSSKPLAYTSNNSTNSPSNSTGNSLNSPNGSNLQRSLTSAGASEMKKALGLRSSGGSLKWSSETNGKPKRPVTIGELMRVQMRVSEAADSRIQRGLLRISAA